MKKNDQKTRTRFLVKYGGLSHYDIYFEKRYSIDDEYIHDELFDIILETYQNPDIELKVI